MIINNILKFLFFIIYFFNIVYKLIKYNTCFKSILLIKIILIVFKMIINKTIKNFILRKSFFYLTYPYKWNIDLFTINFNFINKYQSYYNIVYNVLNVKNTSKVKKGGIFRRFNVLTIVGNKCSWIGIGKSKNFYLTEALENSYIKSFNKIIYCMNNLLGEFIFNNVKYKVKNTQVLFKNFNYTNNISNYNKLNLIFNILGIINIHINVLTNSNLENIIKILTKLHTKCY